MKRVLAAGLAALAVAGCAGEEEGALARPVGASATLAGTNEQPTPPGQGAQTEAPDVARKSVLRRIRAMEPKFSVVDDRLEEGIRAVSGFESKVHCWTRVGWRKLESIQGAQPDEIAGLADFYSFDIHLHPNVCEWLDALIAGHRPETGVEAFHVAASLIALTHEGMHFTSVGSNEAVAQCRAMQNAHKVAARLGVDEEYARRLARLYWEQAYPGDDLNYRSPECRDGGALDINPDTSAWP